MHIDKSYFTLPEILERWQITEADLIYLAENDKLRLSVRVFGVPIESHSLKGMDSLLSIVQMPGGIPVGTLAIGKPGAINAALLAAAELGLALGLLALRLAQHPGIVFGVLKEALLGNPVVRQLGIARQRQVLFNDLLGRAADLALGSRAVEDAVDDVAKRPRIVAGLVARTGLGRSHRANFDWSGAGSAWMRLGSDPADRPGPPARRFAEISGNGTCAG